MLINSRLFYWDSERGMFVLNMETVFIWTSHINISAGSSDGKLSCQFFFAIKIPPSRLVIVLARSFPGVSTHGTRRPRRRLEWLAVGIFLGKPDPQSSSVDLSIWTMVERLVTSKFATDHVRDNLAAFLHLHTIFMTLVCGVCPNLSNNWCKKRLNFQRKGRIFVTLWLPELPLSEPKKTFLQNITSTTFQKK